MYYHHFVNFIIHPQTISVISFFLFKLYTVLKQTERTCKIRPVCLDFRDKKIWSYK